MANQFNLAVHDITVADTTVFNKQGAVIQGKRVTFWVGDHGPFTLTYDSRAQATTQQIKSDIDAQVNQLQELSSYGQS